MADKEPTIVIKKITVVAGGGHGGAWKVAFADFMTALMAFFLVMWLVGQSAEVKQNVSDYFSTPSIIEYNFSNYGVELTLEKLFLDLMNEPLKFFESFIKPVDKTPNIMEMGTKKIVLHHIADQLGDLAQQVTVNEDEISFSIPDYYLFQEGTADFAKGFVSVMDKVKSITQGLEDSNIYLDSQVVYFSNSSKATKSARNLAEKRVDILANRIELGLENETVDIFGKSSVERYIPEKTKARHGFIKLKVKQKDQMSEGKKRRKLETLFGETKKDMNVYDSFVDQLVNQKKVKDSQ